MKTISKLNTLVGFLSFFTLGSLTPTSASIPVAKINDRVITLDEFNKKYRENIRFFQLKPPTKQGVLDDLIKRELAIQQAKNERLDKDPEVIDRMNTVLYHALLEKNLTKDFEGIHVTDPEARSYYDKNPEIRTSHIFVGLRPDASPKDQKQAYEKIKKIKTDFLSDGKMSFAEVAQRFSEGPSVAMGGDIEYQTRDRLDPNYYETALKLGAPGKISEIIRTQFGYHIIKLTALRSWEDVDKAQIKRLVFEEKRSKIFDKYMETLRKQAQVSVHAELIKE